MLVLCLDSTGLAPAQGGATSAQTNDSELTTTLQDLEAAAERGDPAAQNGLGEM